MPLFQRLQRLWQSLGRFPARRVTWGLALVFGLWAVADVMVFHVSTGLALSTYDLMVAKRFHSAGPDPRVVIVDIDEASLARMGKTFGQWPWPRDTLATVLAHIEQQQPLAVVWDVVFSEADLLNPGGDAAFDAAVRKSPNSHFSVVRLSANNDAQSQITRSVLPGLWASGPSSASASAATVALIPPVLPAVAAGRLGYNNGYVDGDGVLRRFRYGERLPDGSVIQSLPLSLLSVVNPIAQEALVQAAAVRPLKGHNRGDELIAWRAMGSSYPLVPIADVFAVAEGTLPLAPVPSFAGKVVVIGSTAPGLHDVHPTPLSPYHHGVDSMATVMDNALNHRHLRELPRGVQALLACALFGGIALWVGARGVSSLAPVTLLLPGLLLLISYLSLNLSPLFIDLHLAAGLGLLFLACLRAWNTLRRDYWCCLPEDFASVPHSMWLLLGRQPWADAAFDRLLSAVQHHVPSGRVVAADALAIWPAQLHWPDMAQAAAILAPSAQLAQALPGLQRSLQPWLLTHGELRTAPAAKALMPALYAGWSALHNGQTQGSVTTHPLVDGKTTP